MKGSLGILIVSFSVLPRGETTVCCNADNDLFRLLPSPSRRDAGQAIDRAAEDRACSFSPTAIRNSAPLPADLFSRPGETLRLYVEYRRSGLKLSETHRRLGAGVITGDHLELCKLPSSPARLSWIHRSRAPAHGSISRVAGYDTAVYGSAIGRCYSKPRWNRRDDKAERLRHPFRPGKTGRSSGGRS